MKSEIAVVFENVSKIYRLKNSKQQSKNFYAVKDLSFEIKKGDIVGIIGTNGSGKSTLSALISEVSYPDEGMIEINGNQALISIHTGLNNQLTGVENIKMKGALLGLSKKEVDEMLETVMDFSELGDFLYQPVKSYSSGMKSRLGFSISLALNPDIMIIDEALSVGDKTFADKCIQTFEGFKEQGKTIFFVSHSLAQVKSFCTTALWIEGGTLKAHGPIDEVATLYSEYLEGYKHLSDEEKRAVRDAVFQSRLIEKKPSWIQKLMNRYV